jgi:hypothetical protein
MVKKSTRRTALIDSTKRQKSVFLMTLLALQITEMRRLNGRVLEEPSTQINPPCKHD